MRSVIYARVSDDREGRGLAVARQERECRELCARNGWEVAEVLVDNDISAYRNRRRPAYEKLLEGVRDGLWDVVVAWHPDRLTRKPTELEEFIEAVEKADVRVATVEAGTYDLSTATGRMTARVVGAVARHESEHKAARQRAKHAELAREGRVWGGKRSFGFLDGMTGVHPVEGPLVAEAVRRLLDGQSLRSTTVWLTENSPTVNGRPWSTLMTRRLTTSARIAGKREYRGEVFDAVWPAIVPWPDVVRLRSVFADPTRRLNLRSRKYLLTGGLAVCGICDKPLHARPKDGGARCYICASGVGFHGCGKIRRLADPLEEDVVTRLINYLRRLPPTEPEREDTSHLRAEVERLEDALAQLAEDYYVRALVSREQFLAANDAHHTALTAARRQLEIAGAPHRDRDRLADLARLEESPLTEVRPIVAAWVDRVTVHPAIKGRNFYDHDRVNVDWRP